MNLENNWLIIVYSPRLWKLLTQAVITYNCLIAGIMCV